MDVKILKILFHRKDVLLVYIAFITLLSLFSNRISVPIATNEPPGSKELLQNNLHFQISKHIRPSKDFLFDVPSSDEVSRNIGNYSKMGAVIGLLQALNEYKSDVDTSDILKQVNDLAFKLHKKLYVAQARNADFISNPSHLCTDNKHIHILTVIHTATSHFEHRDTIRHTWGGVRTLNDESHVVVFAVGYNTNRTIQQQLVGEYKKHGDVLMINYHDTYKNLTYKALAVHKWISTYCMHAKYVLKSDDDVIVNIYGLVDHLKNLQIMSTVETKSNSSLPKNLLTCALIKYGQVLRKEDSKWFVTLREYQAGRYPPYCPGMAYVMSTDVVLNIYKASLNSNHVWIDDLYITGILAQKIGLRQRPMNSVYSLSPSWTLKVFTGRNRRTYLFGLTSRSKDIRILWTIIQIDHQNSLRTLV